MRRGTGENGFSRRGKFHVPEIPPAKCEFDIPRPEAVVRIEFRSTSLCLACTSGHARVGRNIGDQSAWAQRTACSMHGCAVKAKRSRPGISRKLTRERILFCQSQRETRSRHPSNKDSVCIFLTRTYRAWSLGFVLIRFRFKKPFEVCRARQWRHRDCGKDSPRQHPARNGRRASGHAEREDSPAKPLYGCSSMP